MDGDLKNGGYGRARTIDRRSKTETMLSSSCGDEPRENMIVVGKSFPLLGSRSTAPGYQIHECHSDSSINPLHSGAQHKDSFPSEGLYQNVTEHPSASSISFASAISDISTTGAMQKKLYEMESELSGKNATISFLKKQLNIDGDKNIEFTSVAVETDTVFHADEDYHSHLDDLQFNVKKGEIRMSDLFKELKEILKVQGKHLDQTPDFNVVNRLYELVRTKACDTGISLEEFITLQDRVLVLEDNLLKKDEYIRKLEEYAEQKDRDSQQNEKLAAETAREFFEYKRTSTSIAENLMDRIRSLEEESEVQKRIYTEKISERQKSVEDEITAVKKQLDAQYSEERKRALEKCRSTFKKLSEMPKTRLENIMKLCETDKFDIMLLQKDWEDEKLSLEKRINSLQAEKNEMNRLAEGYESKISILKSQILSLDQQLKERKETLETFENELKLYRNENSKREMNEQSSCNFNKLKQLHEAEILSQQEKHKLEKDLLQNKVKQLSDEILSHANTQRIHLQEMQTAKLMASKFRKKYERLLSEWEEKMKSKKASDHIMMITEMDLENSLIQFKTLIHSLKKAEEIHEAKIDFLKKLDKGEKLIHEREINLLSKLEGLKGLGDAKKKSKGKQEAGGDGMLSYELKTYPAQNKLMQTTRLASLEQRLNKLETIIGSTPENLNRLQLSEFKNLSEAAHEISARINLLDANQIERINGKLGSVITKMDNIAEKMGGHELVDQQAKINELYEFLGRSEAHSQSLKPIMDRLIALKSLHVEAADFKRSLKELETEQVNMANNVSSNEAALKKVEEALKDHLQVVTKNIQAFESRLSAVKK